MIYTIVSANGRWEDYHETTVFSTTDLGKAHTVFDELVLPTLIQLKIQC
jgi:hypothetical protein